MAQRLSDTEKWKKGLLRSLEGPYKLLWIYLCDDCDHGGIWHFDPDGAELRTGFKYDWGEVRQVFADKIHVFDDGNKWFIPSFIDFHYGELNPENRVHNSALKILRKYNLVDSENKVCLSPLEGAKNKNTIYTNTPTQASTRAKGEDSLKGGETNQDSEIERLKANEDLWNWFQKEYISQFKKIDDDFDFVVSQCQLKIDKMKVEDKPQSLKQIKATLESYLNNWIYNKNQNGKAKRANKGHRSTARVDTSRGPGKL